MKKKFIAILLTIAVATASTSCGAQKTDTSSGAPSSSSTASTTAESDDTDELDNTLEMYDDDTLTCSYDKKYLSYCHPKATDKYPYWLILGESTIEDFSENSAELTESMKNGNIVCFFDCYMSTGYDDSQSYLLPSYAKLVFDSLFAISGTSGENKSKISSENNNTYRYEYTSDEVTCYGKLFSMASDEVIFSICRILKGTDKNYADALLNCFESIEYKCPEQDADTTGEVTSGPIYEAITGITDDVDCIIKCEDDLYSVSINQDDLKEFVAIAKEINKKVFHGEHSAIYSLNTSSKKDAASITVICREDSTFSLSSVLTVLDKSIENKLKKIYKNDSYWNKLDLDTQSEEAWDKILKKYSK